MKSHHGYFGTLRPWPKSSNILSNFSVYLLIYAKRRKERVYRVSFMNHTWHYQEQRGSTIMKLGGLSF